LFQTLHVCRLTQVFMEIRRPWLSVWLYLFFEKVLTKIVKHVKVFLLMLRNMVICYANKCTENSIVGG